MTIEDIEMIPKEWLTPQDVAPFFGYDPQSIRVQIQTNGARSMGVDGVVVCGRSIRFNKDLLVHQFKVGA